MDIPLIDESDIKTRKGEKSEIGEKEERYRKVVKKEKPTRILRIRYYEKISLPFMEDGKLGHKDVFAVDRSLESLLKALYYNTSIQGMIAPPGCIFVEKDDRMGSNNKFIFIDINKEEFFVLKRQLEDSLTVYALNKGELLIMEGKRSSLSEMFDMPRIWRKDNNK